MSYIMTDIPISTDQMPVFDQCYGRSSDKNNNGIRCWNGKNDRFLNSINSYGFDFLLVKENKGYSLIKEQPIDSTNKIIKSEEIISLSDTISILKNRLGLPASEIAKYAGTSRATLYNHLSMANSVSTNVEEKYNKLFELASFLKENDFNVKNGLKSVLVDGKTLLSHLRDEQLDFNQLAKYIEHVSTKIDSINPNKSLTIEDERELFITKNSRVF
ncbi:hypothetical protein ISO79_15570 [Morganella morganii subsp. morganii]|uniref:hypothetical protein n=1 Tax=Morganella morganii TaxID=582 RepID=UPI001BDAC98D|nr:hypothetical protein [Morganella morganii]MBT0375141.1 hypothetical protein [Morganella morganii subsp. morganii]